VLFGFTSSRSCSQEEDEEPIIQFNPKQQRAVRSAAPPMTAGVNDDESHAIQFSTRPQRSAPVRFPATSPRAHVVGVGMTIKISTNTNPRLNGKMMVMAIAPEGGAYDSGQIEVGDLIVGIGETPDLVRRISSLYPSFPASPPCPFPSTNSVCHVA